MQPTTAAPEPIAEGAPRRKYELLADSKITVFGVDAAAKEAA
jgi:hypothetical protein